MRVWGKSIVRCWRAGFLAAVSMGSVGCSETEANSGGGAGTTAGGGAASSTLAGSGGSAMETAGAASGGASAAAGSRNGGSASGGAEGDAGPGACRAGTPTDAPALFQKLAGTYAFSVRDKACDFRSHSYASSESYQVTVRASPQTVEVSTSAGTKLFTVSWHATTDLGCEDDFTESFELHDGSDTVRIAFIGMDFASLSFGQCWFAGS